MATPPLTARPPATPAEERRLRKLAAADHAPASWIQRARIITAEGELQASEKLAKAAAAMADTPTALQLRLLQTMVEVAAEKNSTLVLPFPVEMLRYFESMATGTPAVPRREEVGKNGEVAGAILREHEPT